MPDSAKPSLVDRLRSAFLKPAEPGKAAKPQKRSVEELEAVVKFADDKERLIGLLAAPFAAIIGFIVTSALDKQLTRTAFLKDGNANKLHVSVSLYHDVTLVLLALAIAMLATAWFRKRLYLAIVMALYGLAIFNLHYWGFSIPYIMVGAWMLVRAYRAQRDLREASGQQAVPVWPAWGCHVDEPSPDQQALHAAQLPQQIRQLTPGGSAPGGRRSSTRCCPMTDLASPEEQGADDQNQCDEQDRGEEEHLRRGLLRLHGAGLGHQRRIARDRNAPDLGSRRVQRAPGDGLAVTVAGDGVGPLARYPRRCCRCPPEARGSR